MACLEMYNPKNTEHNKSSSGAPHPHPHTTLASPRISFSNDFIDSSSSSSSSSSLHHHHHQIRAAAAAYRDAPVSSDFEFSVSNYSMMSADELFFKGRLLPLKEGNQKTTTTTTTTTLRDELLNHEDDGGNVGEEGGFSLRPPKNPTRWRGFLGLRKSHIGSKKPDKAAVEKRPSPYDDDDDNNNV